MSRLGPGVQRTSDGDGPSREIGRLTATIDGILAFFCPFALSSVGLSRNRWIHLTCFGGEEGAEQGWATTFGYSRFSGVRIQQLQTDTPCPYPFPILSPRLPATLERIKKQFLI
jgi:hypothetical protein